MLLAAAKVSARGHVLQNRVFKLPASDQLTQARFSAASKRVMEKVLTALFPVRSGLVFRLRAQTFFQFEQSLCSYLLLEIYFQPLCCYGLRAVVYSARIRGR